MDDYCVETNLSDARGEYMYVNSAAVEKIAEADGITDARGFDTYRTQTRSIDGLRYDMTVTTLTNGLDDPRIIDGRMPEKDKREIIIDTVFAKAHNVKIGTELTFKVATLKKVTLGMSGNNAAYTPEYDFPEYTFTVCGTYHNPDIIYKVNTANTAALPDEFIMAYVNYGEIRSITENAVVDIIMGENVRTMPIPQQPDIDVYTGIRVKGKSDDFDKLFETYTLTKDNLLDVFVKPQDPIGLYMYTLEKDSYPAIVAYDGINDTIAALAAVLPMLFFAVAAAITVISLSKTVDNQRMQIGVIQALGVGKGKVYFSYIFYALFACVVGGFAGGIVGTFTVPYLLEYLYMRQFEMPPVDIHIGVLYMFLGVIISATLACISAFVSCYRTLKTVPAQAMRPKPPKKTKRILAERWTGLWSRLGFGAKMNLRNMFLHKLRMLFSSVGIIGCLMLLVALIGLKDNMALSFDNYEASTGYDLTIATDVAVDLNDAEVYEIIAEADGEEFMHNLTFVPDFSGRIEYGDKHEDLTVMALPTYADEKNYRYADADCIKLYTDLDGNNRVLFESDTFVLPEMTADKLGVKAGDTVRITGYSLDNREIDFEVKVTAIVCEYFDQKAYCAYSVFEEKGAGLYADKVYATFLPGVDRNAGIEKLKNNATVRDVKTFSETYDALVTQMSLLDYAVILFVFGAAALAVAVIYNISATNLKERTREIATLMVLGYKNNETANMLIAENMVITLLGCFFGLPLGYALMLWLVDITLSFKVFIASTFSWYVAIGCVALTFAFSLIATMLLNRKLKKISMVEALKSVE